MSPGIKIRTVQCNSQHLSKIVDFFRRAGFDSTAKSIKEPPASGQGVLMHVSLKKNFDPWKLSPDQVKEWQALPLEVVRKK